MSHKDHRAAVELTESLSPVVWWALMTPDAWRAGRAAAADYVHWQFSRGGVHIVAVEDVGDLPELTTAYEDRIYGPR